MSISNAQFDALIDRLQSESSENPLAYRRNTFLLTAAGFAAMGGLLILTLSLLGVSAWLCFAGAGGIALGIGVKLGIPALLLGRIVIGCLWVPNDPPDGVSLDPGRAPALAAMIEEICKRLNSPRVHRILFTGELNASVVQVPRLGLFGWYENYLILGLPLMASMPPAEFAGVLAHEFGHLSREDGRLSAWVYRARMTWSRLDERLQNSSITGSRYIKKVIAWYAPYFNAYTFVMARQQEYEADRRSAQIVGAAVTAGMLARIQTLSRAANQRFLPALRAHCAEQPQPLADAISRLIKALRTPLEAAEAKRLVDLALGEQTNNSDTHPAFGDRIRALGFKGASVPTRFEQSASERYLGNESLGLQAALDENWRKSALEWWGAEHERLVADAARARELRARLSDGTHSLEETWELAWRTAETEGHEAARPLALSILRLDSDHVGANFIVGSALIEIEDPTGVAHLEKSAAFNGDFKVPALRSLKVYWEQRRQYPEAEDCARRLNEYGDLLELANEERQGITTTDRFLPHHLTEQELAPLLEDLKARPEVREAYLVRKEVLRLPEFPYFILGIVPDAPWYLPRSADDDSKLINELAASIRMPGVGLLISLALANKPFRKPFQDASGSPVYLKA